MYWCAIKETYYIKHQLIKRFKMEYMLLSVKSHFHKTLSIYPALHGLFLHRGDVQFVLLA